MPSSAMRGEASDLTLVTCDGHLGLSDSDRVLRSVLEGLGVSVNAASWSDSTFNWSSTRVAVLRSAWDSHLRPLEFRDWVDKVEKQTALCNVASLVKWNFDKHYLIDLRDAGVASIPAIYVAPHSTASLDVRDIPWASVVIKPAIGASSHGVRRFDVSRELSTLNEHLITLRSTGALLQRFEPAVETLSERSLVFIDGQFTHAVRRLPFNKGNTPDSAEFDHDPSNDEIAFSLNVLKAAKAHDLPFARVDVLPTSADLLLMELELIDPSLFLTRSRSAAYKLGVCLLNRLNALVREKSSGLRI